MRLQKIISLYQHPLLNKKALAMQLFPGLPGQAAAAKLANKVSGAQYKSLTEDEERRLVSCLQSFAREITEAFPQADKTTPPPAPEPAKTTGSLSGIFAKAAHDIETTTLKFKDR